MTANPPFATDPVATSTQPLCIIPARAGSKRLPGKNLRTLAGKPVLAYSIEAALESGIFAKVCVSTEDPTIAQIATHHGADVPFMRPPELATDQATNAQVCLDHLERLEQAGESYETFCLLQPTGPLLAASDLRQAYAQFRNDAVWFVISVTPWEHSPYWALELDHGRVTPHWGQQYLRKTQDLPPLWRPAGLCFWARVPHFKRVEGFYSDHTYAIEIPQERAIDIDTEYDLFLAECIIKNRR